MSYFASRPFVSYLRLRRGVWLAFIVILGLAGTVALQAQPPVALGNPFQVNSFTSSTQAEPQMTMGDDGTFVVVWASDRSDNGDPVSYSIQAQRFASDGSRLGSQILVNAYTTSEQKHPDVVMGSSGDFVVVWRSYGSVGDDTDYSSIQGQRFASDGTPIGGQFQINTYTTGRQRSPQVAMDAFDRFVVVWRGAPTEGGFGDVVQGRKFNAKGSPQGPQFTISSETQHSQIEAEIAMAADGDFVITWQSEGASSGEDTGASVQARRYNSFGSPLGSPFLVNTYTTGKQEHPTIDIQDNGAFVIAWDSERTTNGDDSETSIQAQRFNSNGAPLGGPFLVNSNTADIQNSPRIAYRSEGSFVVVWDGYLFTGNPPDRVQGRSFDATGVPLSDEFAIDLGERIFIRNLDLGVDAEENFVVVWEALKLDFAEPQDGADDTSDLGIVGRRFCGSSCLFADGFESSDLSKWSGSIGQ